MVDGVDSQPLKTQRIQNSDSDTPDTPTRHPIHNKKQQSQKCDQEPLLILLMFAVVQNLYVDKENAVCGVEASILTGSWINIA